MERIHESLRDPSWWFTVVLAGVIAATLGAYFRDWISQLLGHVSRRVRAATEARKERERHAAEELAQDTVLLLVQGVRVGATGAIFATSTIWFLAAPIFWTTMTSPMFRTGSAFIDFPTSRLAAVVTVNLLGLLAGWFGWGAIQESRRFYAGARAYQARRRTEPTPTAAL